VARGEQEDRSYRTTRDGPREPFCFASAYYKENIVKAVVVFSSGISQKVILYMKSKKLQNWIQLRTLSKAPKV
jgi:hypothetical protein